MTARAMSAKSLSLGSLLLLAALFLSTSAGATDTPTRTNAGSMLADQDAWRRGGEVSVEPIPEEIEHPAEVAGMIPKVLHAKKSWGAVKSAYRR